MTTYAQLPVEMVQRLEYIHSLVGKEVVELTTMDPTPTGDKLTIEMANRFLKVLAGYLGQYDHDVKKLAAEAVALGVAAQRDGVVQLATQLAENGLAVKVPRVRLVEVEDAS